MISNMTISGITSMVLMRVSCATGPVIPHCNQQPTVPTNHVDTNSLGPELGVVRSTSARSESRRNLKRFVQAWRLNTGQPAKHRRVRQIGR